MIVSQTVDTVSFTALKISLTVVLTAVQKVVTVVLIAVQISVKNVLMPFQIPSKNVCAVVHTSVQLVPNQPRKTFTTPWMAVRILLTIPLMPFQTAPNISCTPVQACDQLPLNRPMNTSSRPVITPKTVCSTVATFANAPSITGASRLQNPFHIVLMACVTDWNVIPMAASLSDMPATNSWKDVFICVQIWITAFRKSSLFLHSVMITAASPAMAATAIPTGPVMTVKAELSAVCADVSMPEAPPALTYHSTTFPIAFDTCPLKVIVFPRATRSGPAAATNRPILMMFCFVPSSMLFSLSTKSWIFPTMSLIFGISSSPKLIASSSSCDFRIVSWPCRLSCWTSAILSAAPDAPPIFWRRLSNASPESLIRYCAPRRDAVSKIWPMTEL